jgi:beta-lactam-binding protein with PASTA domain
VWWGCCCWSGCSLPSDDPVTRECPEGATCSDSPSESITQVIVPDVVGLTHMEASNAVWNAHLGFAFQCKEGPGCLTDAVVRRQRPQPGTVVSSGTRVTVRMAALVSVPLLVGRTLQQAGNRLDRVDLKLQFFCEGGPPQVLSQRPNPGTVVLEGSTVHVRVGPQCSLQG